MTLAANKPKTKYIEQQDYLSVFSELWSRLEHRFFKLECEQMYSEPEDPAYDAFRRGDTGKSVQLFWEHLKDDEKYLISVSEKNLDYTRLRIVDTPFTEYLKYELKTYQLSARYGQRIFLIDRSTAENVGLQEFQDIMIFDSYAVITMKYDTSGKLREILLDEDANLIRSWNLLADRLIGKSATLGFFERQNCP